jgi:glycolate oxidase FAD binding subunit
VLGIRFINGRGELLTFGGQVIKNVAGYDVSRLMVGALGTLGVLTEISLKVLPIAAAEATLRCSALAQQTALDLLHHWGAQSLPLNASCWVADDCAIPAIDCLFVRLRGALAAVQEALPKLIGDVRSSGGSAAVMDNAQARPDWQACRDQTLPFFNVTVPELGLWRLSVPQTAPALDLPYPQLIEWHGGLRWLWAPLSAQQQVRQAATAVVGSAMLFRAPLAEPVCSTGRFSPLNSVLVGIHQRLKAEFDPAAIFNPGRMYPDANPTRP